jgi:GT2 family glycosyltransferase
MQAAISVILPTFNRERTLAAALGSALAQGFRNLEVIVVDDGSTDGTRALVSDVIASDERVRYHYQPNAGVASARNAGIRLATGAYIAFLDSDDAWQPWHLELLRASLDRFPDAGFAWTDMDTVDAAGAVTAKDHLRIGLSAYGYFPTDKLFSTSVPISELAVEIPPEYGDRRLYTGDIYSPMLMGNLVLVSATLMRRAVIDAIGGFDERLGTGEDHEFFLRACRLGPVAFADISDVLYRVGTLDRLSGAAKMVPLAHAYLELVEETLARDADRITLSPTLIREARSHANRWVGESELQAGSPRVARSYLARALRIGGRRPRTVLALMLTFLPRPAVARIILWRRRAAGGASA